MIENYGDDTKDAPVRQKDESHFSYFGGLLLKQNGEIGYHATTISRSYCRTPIMATNTRTISGRIAKLSSPRCAS